MIAPLSAEETIFAAVEEVTVRRPARRENKAAQTAAVEEIVEEAAAEEAAEEVLAAATVETAEEFEEIEEAEAPLAAPIASEETEIEIEEAVAAPADCQNTGILQFPCHTGPACTAVDRFCISKQRKHQQNQSDRKKKYYLFSHNQPPLFHINPISPE